MSDRVQLRHFDYLLPIGSLAAGASARALTLQLDNDSSFILRSRAVHIKAPTSDRNREQSDLINYFDRFTGPDNNYFSQAVTRFSSQNPDFGQFGSPLIVRPPVIYPPGGVIQIDVTNNDSHDYTGLEVYFRGSKMFAPGILPCLTYPEKFSALQFYYPQQVTAVAKLDNRPDNVLTVDADADTVLRSLTIGSFGGLTSPAKLNKYYQVYIHLKDQDGRFYSNLPVHVDTCFGAMGSIVQGQNAPFRTGPYHPPLFTPEIYIPANRTFQYNVTRDDSSFAQALHAVDLQLCFQGVKVYRQ
jgi:hypothetical protein